MIARSRSLDRSTGDRQEEGGERNALACVLHRRRPASGRPIRCRPCSVRRHNACRGGGRAGATTNRAAAGAPARWRPPSGLGEGPHHFLAAAFQLRNKAEEAAK